MENTSALLIGALSIQPDFREKYLRWYTEVYHPQEIKDPYVMAIDRYQIIQENIEYPRTFSIVYFESMRGVHTRWLNPELEAITKENDEYVRKGLITWTWAACHQLMRQFRNLQKTSEEEIKTNMVSGPIVHLEGLWLHQDQRKTYEEWLSRWGYEIYIPLLMKLPGIKEYKQLCLLPYDSAWPEAFKRKDPDAHPLYLSMLYFEDLKGFETYDKSLERAAFRQSLLSLFPDPVNYRWYVQYQLIQSWRK
jgi:hypothetical protein